MRYLRSIGFNVISSNLHAHDLGVPSRGRWAFALLLRNFSSSTNLFVGGLSYDTNETVLKETFGEFGNIIEVRVICDRKSGRSKGYGFVRFDSESAASKALEELNGKSVDGKNIRVYYAQKQTNMPIKREVS